MSIAGQIDENTITPELVKGNAPLKDLTEDQVNAVVTLGNNAIKDRIRVKTNEIYTGFDKDVEEVTGIPKESGEKTYEYIKRALNHGSKELSGQLAELKSAKKTLEDQVKNGSSDEGTKKQIEELQGKIKEKESEISQWRKKYADDLALKDKAIAEANEKNLKIRVDHNVAEALSSFKFIEEAKLPKIAREATINAAKMSVLSEYTPDFVADGNGNETLVWKKNGEPALNPENSLKPFTTAELLSKHLAPILDPGRTQTGSGTKPPASGIGANGHFSLGGVKSQVEADELIGNHLVAQGIERGTKDFEDKLQQIRTDNKVMDLPFKV